MEICASDEYSSKKIAFFEELIHDESKLLYAISSMTDARVIDLYKYIEGRLGEPLEFNEGERLVDAKKILEENDVIIDYLAMSNLTMVEIRSINETVSNLEERKKRNKSLLYKLCRSLKG